MTKLSKHLQFNVIGQILDFTIRTDDLNSHLSNIVLDHFLFLEAFDNFLGVYVVYKVDMHQKKLNSARISQEINSFAHFLLSCTLMILHKNILTLDFKPNVF